MATIIDYTYFVDALLIPNTDSSGYVGSSMQSQVQRYIGRYEKDFCKELLGDDLGEEFYTAITGTTPATKWTDLRNQLRDTTNKVSPIANYVWYYWYRDQVRQRTGLGDGMPQGQNITMDVNRYRVTDNWNEMVRLNNIFNEWIHANLATYPTYAPKIKVYSHINNYYL